jgi:hypothetical protein
MTGYTPPKTCKKPTDGETDYETMHYNIVDGIKHTDEEHQIQEYNHTGEQLTLTCQTDIDLAGQPDTRQSTSSYILYLNGALFHWRAHTEKLIIKATASGEYIALSRGNQACKHTRDLLKFFGNTNHIYHLYTDNQAAEHLATQPNMNDHARSIDIRHHEIKQDYVQNNMRIEGVSSANSTSDILTKTLQPPLHAKHCAPLHILNLTVQNTTSTLHTMAVFATKILNHINTNPAQLDNKEARKQKRKSKKQRQRERNYLLLAHARQIAKRHHNLTNHETANLTTNLSAYSLTSDTKIPSDRHLPLQMQLEPKPTTQRHRPMPTPTAPRQTSNVNQLIPGQCALLAQKVPPHTVNHTTRTPTLSSPNHTSHVARRSSICRISSRVAQILAIVLLRKKDIVNRMRTWHT